MTQEMTAEIGGGQGPRGYDGGLEASPRSTTFPAPGTVVDTFADGQVVTTTFPEGTLSVRVYGPPLSKTITTVLNLDGSISETES
jgi:hypothetical protein